MLFSYVIKLPNILKWATKDLRAHISYKKCKFYLKRVFFVFKTSISFPILIPILIYEHLMVIGYLYTFVLAFNFPPTTHNIVVGPLLYVFFSLFYFLCKHYYRKKKKRSRWRGIFIPMSQTHIRKWRYVTVKWQLGSIKSPSLEHSPSPDTSLGLRR